MDELFDSQSGERLYQCSDSGYCAGRAGGTKQKGKAI